MECFSEIVGLLNGVKTYLNNIESYSAEALFQFSFNPWWTLLTLGDLTLGVNDNQGSLMLRDLPRLPQLGEILAMFCFHNIFIYSYLSFFFLLKLMTQSFLLNTHI